MAEILSFLETCPLQKIHLDSKRRLQNHILGELSFSNKAAGGAREELASVSSNLNHLEAIVTLLKLPEITCVVGVLQSISSQGESLDCTNLHPEKSVRRFTTGVDLVCLFQGEPAWVSVSARNPDFVHWENTGGESASSSSQTQLTHDTCLKDRVGGLLTAARDTSDLLRPHKIILCFARGLQPSLQKLLQETTGAAVCPVIKPVGFEISVSPSQKQDPKKRSFDFGKRPPISPAIDWSEDMAPDSDALAWSLLETVPSPDSDSSAGTPSADVSKGADGVSKEWIVVEEPSGSSNGRRFRNERATHASARDSKVEEWEGVSASGMRSDGGSNGVNFRVSDAVRQLERENQGPEEGHFLSGDNRTGLEETEALQSVLGLEGSFVALERPDPVEDSSGSILISADGKQCPNVNRNYSSPWRKQSGVNVSQGQEKVKTEELGAKGPEHGLEKGWVAVRLGADIAPLAGTPDQSLVPGSVSTGEEKEWVALFPNVKKRSGLLLGGSTPEDFAGESAGGQWVGVQQPGQMTGAAVKVPGEWVGVCRTVVDSGQNGVLKRSTDRNGNGTTGKKEGKADSDVRSAEVGTGAVGETDLECRGRNETRENGTEEKGAGRKGEPPEVTQTVQQTEIPWENAPASEQTRFRTLNQVPLTARPASWPEGLELVNLDTTALVALVSGVTNGDAEALRAMPEQDFRQRWKGNAGFMCDQVEAEVQYPQLPYLESVTAGKATLVTEYVFQEFVSIVSVVGGEAEQGRAERLLKSCWLIADAPSDRLRSLAPSRAIKERHVAIFGTADAWGCPTLTSNAAFARAVQKQGVPLWVLEHRPSALVGS